MKSLTLAAVAALLIATSASVPAQAKGCIKGAIVGGLAGHMAHHGVLGAAGGCAVGHHMASRRAEDQQRAGDYPRGQYDRQRDPDGYGSR